jgi:hypothetical protein
MKFVPGHWEDSSYPETSRLDRKSLGSQRLALESYLHLFWPNVRGFLGGVVMSQESKDWRKLCAEAAVERDPQRLHELVCEIDRILEEQRLSAILHEEQNEHTISHLYPARSTDSPNRQR